jgi:selenocysteine-specific elongation factor
MHIIGTAGHVDHGKSTLIKCMTGIDPDRLAEEKAREMTIDLGFAWTQLPNGEKIGFVDVPGHRDFVENMLAGIGGIDAVLLVIAADEGIMPQTREHLAILDLLGVQYGLIVVTKIDMVDDPDWLELIEQDIQTCVAGTTLSGAEIMWVSARTGEGITERVECLSTLLTLMPKHIDYHNPRLPIDRVFSIKGFGTVVTGSLSGGTLFVGDEIELQPSGLRGRIRGLQSYGESLVVAELGNRVAVNITGVERTSVERGNVLTHPNQLQPTNLVDVHFRHLSDVGRVLKHEAEVKFFSGTAQSIGHVRLLDDEKLSPGAEAWLQIRLEQPLALANQDRFILRYPSPSETIGGGLVVNPHPHTRWRRFQLGVIQMLELQMRGTPAQRITQAANGPEPISLVNLQQLGFSDAELNTNLSEALADSSLMLLADGSYWSSEAFKRETQRLLVELDTFHQINPLRLGMQREELRVRLKLSPSLLALMIDLSEGLTADKDIVRLATHQITFSPQQQRQIELLNQKMAQSLYAPPSFVEAAQIVGEEVLYALIDLGEIIQIQPGIILPVSAYNAMVQWIKGILDTKGSITANELRDHFSTTRKYAIGLLEHLDSINATRRTGDVRVKGSQSF